MRRLLEIHSLSLCIGLSFIFFFRKKVPSYSAADRLNYCCSGIEAGARMKKEETKMDCHANKSIECSVVSCANHCDTMDYCSLDKIRVGTHECNPTMDQCTDCLSFMKR